MADFLGGLFDPSGFPPRWKCGSWSDGLGYLHIFSDLGVWSAYVAIPLVLGYFALYKRNLPFRNIFWLFGAFILACGTTHLMEAIIFWWPVYRLAAVIKLGTAIVSWGTVIALVPVTPRALAMRSPEESEREVQRRTAELANANESLQAEIHERKRTELALHQQREWFRVTLASIGDAVIVVDPDAKVTFFNPCAQRLTGWSEQEALGAPLNRVFTIINEQSRKGVDSPVAKVLKDHVVVGLANDTVLVAKDGTERPIDDSAAPIRDEQGHVTGVVLVFRDISDRKQADQARRQLAAIVESSEDAIIGNNLDGIIESWNSGAERLYGYTAQEVVGKPLSILSPEGEDELPAIMQRLRRGERTQAYETLRMRKDGEKLNVLLSISPIKNSAGKVVGAAKIAHDITQRSRTEQSLRFLADASQTLAALVDYHSTLQKVANLAVPYFADWCAIDMVEPDGRLSQLAVAHVNPAKVELALELNRRYPPMPDSPRGAPSVVRSGHSEIIEKITEEMIDAGARDAEHLRILRELGLKSYICVPLVVRDKILGAITFIAAESGRHFTATDLTVAEDLARRAAVAIENARLYREVRDADRRKDEFLAMLAHELRNPLTPIRTGLDLLAMGQFEQTHIAMMQQQVEHMVRLVDDLLDVSRIMQGKIVLRKEPVELDSVVRKAVETARPLIESQQHKLTVTLPSEPLWLDADAVRLAQVIANLLSNSAKYTEPGGQISLTAERAGNTAVLRVSDNGIGISADMLTHIFGLFIQADCSLERSQGGLGIGLTLVQSLVQMHGGSVQAQSDGLSQGSQFVVQLPTMAQQPRGDVHAQRQDKPSIGPSPSRRILVVDDSVALAEILAALLKRIGPHEIRMAHDGPSALEVAKSFRPQVVLLDIGLPGMSGHDVARHLRAESESAGALLVALTGYGTEADRQRTRESGFDHHLVKPVSMETLRKIIAEPRLDSGSPDHGSA